MAENLSADSYFELPSQVGSSASFAAATDSQSSLEDEADPARKRKKGLEYREIQHFKSPDDFKAWWKTAEDAWRFHDFKDGVKRDVESWKCKYADRVGYSCKVRLRVCYSGCGIVVEEAQIAHDHRPSEKAPKLTDDLKKRIAQLAKERVMPKRIHFMISKELTSGLPTLEQIQDFVKRQRPSNSEPVTDHLVRTYCEENSERPLDDNIPYVVAYEVVSEKKFFILWSTNRMMERQFQHEQLQVDGTNCLLWHNFPLLVLGHSDINRHFIPSFVALGLAEDTYTYASIFEALKDKGYTPKVVLGDGSAALTAAVEKALPSADRAMCYAHMIRVIDKKKSSVDAEDHQQLRKDVAHVLRYARSEPEFKQASYLMREAWEQSDNEKVAAFTEYFFNQWVQGALSGWFEAFSIYCVNNNGLESLNNSIKREHTLRRRGNFGLFIKEVVVEMLAYWSSNLKEVPAFPDIELKTFKAAYELEKSGRLYSKVRASDRFVVASANAKIANSHDLFNAYKRSFLETSDNWIDYASRRFEVHVVRKVEVSGATFYLCSCADGCKKVVCKHSVFIMASVLKVIEYPPEITAKHIKPNHNNKASKAAGRTPLASTQHRFAVRGE